MKNIYDNGALMLGNVQMVINEVPMIKWKEVTELSSTERGTGGFGSTNQ